MPLSRMVIEYGCIFKDVLININKKQDKHVHTFLSYYHFWCICMYFVLLVWLARDGVFQSRCGCSTLECITTNAFENVFMQRMYQLVGQSSSRVSRYNFNKEITISWYLHVFFNHITRRYKSSLCYCFANRGTKIEFVQVCGEGCPMSNAT